MRTGFFRVVRCVAMAALWIGVTAGAAEAQLGRIRGIVRDTSGESVSRVLVKAEPSEGRGGAGSSMSSSARLMRPRRSVRTTTDDGGRFALLGLQRGDWIFTVEAPGFRPFETRVRISAAGSSVSFVLTPDVATLDVPRGVVPSTGLLAGVAAEDIQLELDTADTLYEAGQYDEAIEVYEAVLARVPVTTINLQIGHAYREQKEYSKARAAYEEVLRSDPTNEEAKDALRTADLEENGQAAPRQPRQP